VVLPGASLHAAEAKAGLLCRAVSQLQVTHLDASLGSVTMSVGVASYPEHGRQPEELLRAADAALYQAKRQGRNRVVVGELDEADHEGASTVPS
jgi:diguanylate cyclase (GGDEF)-like protein